MRAKNEEFWFSLRFLILMTHRDSNTGETPILSGIWRLNQESRQLDGSAGSSFVAVASIAAHSA